jgi:hypothetical protein
VPNKHGRGLAPRLSALFNHTARKRHAHASPTDSRVYHATEHGYISQNPRTIRPEEKTACRTGQSLARPKNSRKYAPVDSTTSFGLRPPEKKPWKPNDDRFDTSTAREIDRPIGGAPRQHLVVRPTKKAGGAGVAGPETKTTPESQSQGECKSFCWVLP